MRSACGWREVFSARRAGPDRAGILPARRHRRRGRRTGGATRLAARLQRRLHAVLFGLDACRRLFLNPDGMLGGLAASRPEHRGELRDQHELAVLRGRVDDVLPDPDGRDHGADLRLGRGRDGGARSPSSAASRAGRASELGNFWVDLYRSLVYVLLPLTIVLTLVFVSQGVPQTFAGHATATTLEGATQTIARGPVALAGSDQEPHDGRRRLLQLERGNVRSRTRTG